MSYRKENVERQTEFRHAVLENGYTPLPNHDKRNFYEGWSEVQPTHALIDKWASSLSYQATGLRVENGLCAIDVDVNDEDFVEELWAKSIKAYPQLREALVRYGSGAKEAWFCRTDEEFSRIASTKHVKPGQDPEGEKVDGHQFEAFGGGHARQMGAWGAHTLRADSSGALVEYEWAEDESPADVLLSDLPMVPKSAVLHIAEIASQMFVAKEWPRVTHARSGETDCSTIYDLTQDMIFNCLDGQSRTLDELEAYALSSRNPRCSASWTGDRTMTNRTRCLIGVDRKGHPTVLETANWERHMAADEADREMPTGDKTTALADKLKSAGYTFDEENFFDAPADFRAVVLDLLANWAWCGSRNAQCLPIHRAEEHAMSLANLRLTYSRHCYEREGPRGGVQKINPVDAWVVSPDREDVDGYRFMPDKPPGVFHTMGVRAINSYAAPQHVVVTEDRERAFYQKLWLDFMEHLLPSEEEREWFMSSLAHKRQNLTTPGVATIMVARNFGVGRGTLFSMVEAIFGQAYVNNVNASNLMGTDTQGQYNDWMADTLFVTTDEVLPDGDDGQSMAWRRKKAYERLKERVDPAARQMMIVRKSLPNYQDMVYTSFILATQHENALPIPAGDRRFVVLTNNQTTLAGNAALKRRIDAIRKPTMNMDFIGAIDQWLVDRDVSDFDAHYPPSFGGKEKMLNANVGEVEEIVGDVLEGMPYDWCTMDAALGRVEKTLVQRDLKDSYPKWRAAASDAIKQHWTHHVRTYIGDRTKKHHVYLREAVSSMAFDDATPEERRQQLADMMRLDVGPSAKMRAFRAGLREA